MEKVALIDFTLEDDSLLPSTSTAENRHPQPHENNLQLSPTLVSEMIMCIPKEQKQSPNSNSGNMNTGDIDMLKITDINTDVKPSFGSTRFSAAVATNPDATSVDGEQVQQHGKNMNWSGRERLEAASRALSSKGFPRQAGKKKTRSARVSSQLRKSLAWDKAFSTDEGVLDLDELPFVNKTPRKLPELQPLDIPAILGFPSPTPTPEVEKNALPSAETVAHGDSIGSCPEQELAPSDLPPKSEGVASVPNGHVASVNVAPKTPSKATARTPSEATAKTPPETPAKTPCVLDTKASSKSDKTRLVPATQIIKADVLKGTRLKLPGTFTGKKEKVEPSSTKAVSEAESIALRRCKSSSSVLSTSSATTALSKKVSSVSKKVKNTLGKVLPGAFGGSPKTGKISESSGSHHGSAPLDAISEDLENSLEALPISKSKSSRGFVSGIAAQATVQNPRKEGAQAEKTNSENTSTTATLESGMIVSNLKASSKMKNVGLLMSLCSRAGPLSKKPSEKPSFYSTKISPVFSRKKSGPAAPTTVPAEKQNLGTGAQNSSKGSSSGLRLPSPKMGFFDSARALTGEQPPSLPSSDISNRRNPPNGGLPPKSKLGAPSAAARRAEQQAYSDKGKVASTRSGTSSAAPQVKSREKRQKAWGSSATTAPHSPQKRARGWLSPPSSKQAAAMNRLATPKTNVGHSHSTVSEEREGNGAAKASKKLVLDATSDGASDLPQSRTSDSTAQLGAAMEPPLSSIPSRTQDSDVEFGSPGKEKYCTATSLVSTKTPCKPSFPSNDCIQSAGLIKESITDGRLSAVVEELSPGSKGLFGSNVIDSILCRDEAGSVIDALTSSHGEQPRIGTKLPSPLGRADDSRAYEDSADISARSQGAHCAAPGLTRGGLCGSPASEVKDKFSNDVALQEASVGMDLLELKRRSLDRLTHERDKLDPATAVSSSVCERSLKQDSVIGDIVIHDVAEVMMGLEEDEDVVPGDSGNVAPLEKEITVPDGNSAINKEPTPQPRKPFDGQQHDKSKDVNSKTDHAVDNPLPCSDRLPVGGAAAPMTHVKEEQNKSPLTTVAGRRTVGRTVNVERAQEMPDITVRRTSPVAAFDCQGGKISPLAANAGILNRVGGTRVTNTQTPSKMAGQTHVEVDHHSVSESEFCGQENRRSSEEGRGTAGHTHQAQKPKQRKPFLTLNLDRATDEDESSHVAFAFSEERLRALEAAGQETLEKKGGAVQHSPPHKTSPNRNPWSPVKKNGQQLGPFDCTKKYTSAPLGL